MSEQERFEELVGKFNPHLQMIFNCTGVTPEIHHNDTHPEEMASYGEILAYINQG